MKKHETEDDFKNQDSEKIEISKADFDKLQGQAAELEAQKEKLLRTVADFENAKKRLAREREEFVKYSQESLFGELLPIIDNFDRALGHQTNLEALDADALKKQLKSLMTGTQMVKKQFLDILQNHGIKPVKSVGEIYDPHKHEVIEYVPGEGRPEEIIEEIQPGYMLHDRLLRAAKVRVRAPLNPAS